MVLSLKPCGPCLKKRQAMKDALTALSGRKIARKQLIECDHGDLTTEARTVVSVTNEDHRGLIGTKVYVGGKKLYAVEDARHLTYVGRVLKLSTIAD